MAEGHAKRAAQGRDHSAIAPRQQVNVKLAPRSPSIGAKEPIPYRETETIVTVSFHFNHGMMDTVHVGCNQHTTHPRLEPCGQRHVGMVEHRGCVEQQLKCEDGDNGRTERSDCDELDKR